MINTPYDLSGLEARFMIYDEITPYPYGMNKAQLKKDTALLEALRTRCIGAKHRVYLSAEELRRLRALAGRGPQSSKLHARRLKAVYLASLITAAEFVVEQHTAKMVADALAPQRDVYDDLVDHFIDSAKYNKWTAQQQAAIKQCPKPVLKINKFGSSASWPSTLRSA